MASTFKDFLLAPFIKHFVKMLRLHIRWSLEHTTWKFRGRGGRPAVASKFILCIAELVSSFLPPNVKVFIFISVIGHLALVHLRKIQKM